jgi:hypothetical protein
MNFVEKTLGKDATPVKLSMEKVSTFKLKTNVPCPCEGEYD